MYLDNLNGDAAWSSVLFDAYITSGTTQQYSILVDPTPGAPASVITKTVSFDVLRSDVFVAHQLKQLGDDKFADALVKNIGLAEKLSGKCAKRDEHADKKGREPAVNVLKLFVKRLELANKKCGEEACGEEETLSAFRKAHTQDHDYDATLPVVDKAKRFVTDEALKIITKDAQWLIKSFGGISWRKPSARNWPAWRPTASPRKSWTRPGTAGCRAIKWPAPTTPGWFRGWPLMNTWAAAWPGTETWKKR